jgi:hypothetical protein
MSVYREIVGLGNSFAAGPGLDPLEDANAVRSCRNYADALAEHIGVGVISGATTAAILDSHR